MKAKRLLALMMCLVLGIMMVPVTAQADVTKYTVILDPGEGTGERIVYSAYKGEITKSIDRAGYNEFYIDDDGTIGFKMDDRVYPESFTAPEGYVFDGWEGAGTYNRISSGETTFAVKWKRLISPEYAIGNIKQVSNGKTFFIGEGEWKLIGEDKDNGIGLVQCIMPYYRTWQNALDSCSEVFKSFSEAEQKLVISTSKSEETYESNGNKWVAPALDNARVFLFSAGEAMYYKSCDGWTRSAEEKTISHAGKIWGLTIKIYNKNIEDAFAPVFLLDLNAYNEMVQALPPALPEGTFLSKTGTYKITNKKKKEVQMIEGTVSLKGAVTVPKTVTYEKKKYKVTSLGGMLFDGNSELKTINITAGNLKKVGKFAFRFINSKAVFKIRGTKKQFKKIKKLIKASKGLPKGVKFRRVK